MPLGYLIDFALIFYLQKVEFWIQDYVLLIQDKKDFKQDIFNHSIFLLSEFTDGLIYHCQVEHWPQDGCQIIPCRIFFRSTKIESSESQVSHQLACTSSRVFAFLEKTIFFNIFLTDSQISNLLQTCCLSFVPPAFYWLKTQHNVASWQTIKWHSISIRRSTSAAKFGLHWLPSSSVQKVWLS